MSQSPSRGEISARSPVRHHGRWVRGAGSPPDGEKSSVEVVASVVAMKVMVDVVVVKSMVLKRDEVLGWR